VDTEFESKSIVIRINTFAMPMVSQIPCRSACQHAIKSRFKVLRETGAGGIHSLFNVCYGTLYFFNRNRVSSGWKSQDDANQAYDGPGFYQFGAG